MKRFTDEEIARLLKKPRHGTPPTGLADRIKSEIPDYLEVGGSAPQARRGGLGAVLRFSTRPLWLLAASLLVVIGVGFVAVQLIQPAHNLSREIALEGVAVPEPYEIVVPPRWSVEPGRAPQGATPPGTPQPGSGR